MAIDYVILTPPEPGPFQTILTSGGEPVAFQVPEKWGVRIVRALKLLDAYEQDTHGAYIEKLKRKIDDESNAV